MSNTHDTFEWEEARPKARSRSRRGIPRKHRKVILGLWGRYLLVLIAIAVTGLLAVQTALRLARPYELGARQAKALSQATAQRDALLSENADLERQCAYLNRPDGIESAARTLGYLRPGEISLVLVPAAQKAASPTGR